MKNLLYILTFVMATAAIAQNTTSVAFEKQKLQQAKAYGDEEIVTSVMYNLIVLEGPQSTYKDSLAYIYFNKRKYVSSFLVANDILKQKPDNAELLEIKAVSLESMGALDKAREGYEQLLAKSNNNYHAYKLASIEFRMNKANEAYATIKKADNLPDNGNINITFQVNQNYNQNVPLKASIAYLEGLIGQSLNKSVEAKASFQRAIQLFPEFTLAKSKLELIEAKENEAKN